MQLEGRRVTIMGLGHFGGGAAVARWMARQGAVLTVTDLADREVLADSLAAVADVPIAQLHLGGHREDDFRRADLVVVNPAVRPGNRFLRIADEAGARLTSETELFLELCPGRVIGVTGSNGKSTTAAMIAAVVQAEGRRVWLGGNIGDSLLGRLDRIDRLDWVVLELSSFQLWHLAPGARLPHVAVVTNCSPNHLNWHGSFEHYLAAKQRILTGQSGDSLAVLNTLDPEVASWAHLVQGRQLPLAAASDIPDLAVPGEHNRVNAACAATAAKGIGCSLRSVREGLASFCTLPGRLEMFAVVEGRRFYNDTTATTPDSTIAALRALKGGTWLLAGGSDKGIDFGPLTETIARCTRGAAFFGAVREVLHDRQTARSPHFPCTAAETMDEALRWCWQRSRPGDSIVLSPACASYDQYRNFRDRGKEFVELSGALADHCKR